MLQKDVISQVAQRLNQAEKTREQIRQISLDHPQITIEDAYAIQREWVGLKIAEGRSLKGHKIGLTSKAMQASSQIDEPDYGALLDDMFFDDGCEIPTDRFIVPRIEVELAFVLAKPLSGPNCTLFDVYNATDYVIPALELIDARCHGIDPETKRPRKVFDTISDNAANAAVILGGDQSNLATLIYDGSVHCCTVTVLLKSLASRLRYLTTLQTGLLGWQINSRHTTSN